MQHEAIPRTSAGVLGWGTVILAFAFFVPSAAAAPPYIFVPGGQIRASELNANFQALESRIDAKGAPTPENLYRFSAACPGFTNATVPLFAVPANAPRPWVIRQTTTPEFSGGTPALSVAAEQIYIARGISPVLLIPVAPGESVSLACSPSTIWAATVVVSK